MRLKRWPFVRTACSAHRAAHKNVIDSSCDTKQNQGITRGNGKRLAFEKKDAIRLRARSAAHVDRSRLHRGDWFRNPSRRGKGSIDPIESSGFHRWFRWDPWEILHVWFDSDQLRAHRGRKHPLPFLSLASKRRLDHKQRNRALQRGRDSVEVRKRGLAPIDLAMCGPTGEEVRLGRSCGISKQAER